MVFTQICSQQMQTERPSIFGPQNSPVHTIDPVNQGRQKPGNAPVQIVCQEAERRPGRPAMGQAASGKNNYGFKRRPSPVLGRTVDNIKSLLAFSGWDRNGFRR